MKIKWESIRKFLIEKRKKTVAIIIVVSVITLIIASAVQTPKVDASPPELLGKMWHPERGWLNLYNFTITVTAGPLIPVWVTVKTNGRIIDFIPLNLPFDQLGNETVTLGPIWPSGHHEIAIVVDISVADELHYNTTARTPFSSVEVGI